MMTTGNPLSVAMMTITFFVDMNIYSDFRVFLSIVLFHTRSHSLPKALFAFASLLQNGWLTESNVLWSMGKLLNGHQ